MLGITLQATSPDWEKSRKRRVGRWKNPDINNLWQSQQQLYRVLEDQAWSGLQSNLLDYVSIPRYWWNCWVLQESSSAVAKKSLLGHRDVLTAPPLLLQFHVEWMLLPSQDTQVNWQGQKACNGPQYHTACITKHFRQEYTNCYLYCHQKTVLFAFADTSWHKGQQFPSKPGNVCATLHFLSQIK
jgi:hypothetical protein